MHEIAAFRVVLIAAQPDFYLAHKIAMDVSFHIEIGIFIPHTATLANQALYEPGSKALDVGRQRPPCLLITEGNHRYEYTTEAA
ncbi:hypothetical protein [Pantoea wallisii]|uniref:hypothetical protein n=1 Tax=Pantoea wallisii TaxID=1076551 RepID=UPI000FFC1435|nr:hypothetical protein [Pantoea wallisii]